MGSSQVAEFVQTAPLGDILGEQLDYLIEHATRVCLPGCADCERLQQIKLWLLRPFWDTRQSRRRTPSPLSKVVEFVQEALLGGILHEQLGYLVDHATQNCAPGCSDCARLQKVKSWLLLPFGATRRPRASRRAAGL